MLSDEAITLPKPLFKASLVTPHQLCQYLLYFDLKISKQIICPFQATDSMKMTMTASTIERDVAIRELRKAKQEIERLDKEGEQVGDLWRPEVDQTGDREVGQGRRAGG